MATSCPSFLRGTALRATRLDSCGRPVYGECGQVVSDGFVTIEMSAETDDGDDISVTKANGQTCVSVAPCTQFKWYETSIELCEVDPDLVQIMNPTWEKVLDAQGNTIGYDANGTLDCSTGFALEIWMETYQAADACAGSGSQGSYGYMLLPWVIGGAPDDLEITNDAISFTFTGKTKIGSGWRRGPYPVQLQENGAPGPLLRPIGPDTHYRLFTTTIRPPEPECGCQPVDRPTPEPAEVILTGLDGETNRRTVRLRVNNHGFGPVTVTWGDENSEEVQDGATVSHTYAEDGDYTLTVADKESPAVNVTRDITIPLQPDTPELDLTPGSDTNRMIVTAEVTLPAHSTGSGTIDWGDGTDRQDITVGDDNTVSLNHTYAAAGVYTVTVRRADVDTYRTRLAVAVPIADAPTLTVEKGEGANDANITWDNHGNGPVTIDWGDSSATEDGEVTGSKNHTYEPGDHTITVISKANPAAKAVENVTIPIGGAEAPTLTVEKGEGDNDAKATWDNHDNGPVTIDWGDDSETEEGQASGNTEHTYEPGTYTVTVTSQADTDAKADQEITIPIESGFMKKPASRKR